MNTFLPLPDFKASLALLDRRRLRTQCWEVHQLLNALAFPNSGWQDHPVKQMWEGYDQALVVYGLHACERLAELDGSDPLCAKFVSDHYNPRKRFVMPWWVGDGDLHFSHQSNLVREDWKFYRPLFATAPLAVPYYWPKGAPVKTDELTKKSCAVSPTEKHVMEVARMRGNRHRTRCKHCGVFSQWEKQEANNYQAKAQNFARLAEAPDFTKMTVPALKEYAQKNDIVINSKMKKAELIAACSA